MCALNFFPTNHTELSPTNQEALAFNIGFKMWVVGILAYDKYNQVYLFNFQILHIYLVNIAIFFIFNVNSGIYVNLYYCLPFHLKLCLNESRSLIVLCDPSFIFGITNDYLLSLGLRLCTVKWNSLIH